MPRIPYADPATITDPEVLGYLDLARREGTPRPESQAIRANNPPVLRAFSQAWDLTFRNGVCDHNDPSRLDGKDCRKNSTTNC
jgi:hypothetical protein